MNEIKKMMLGMATVCALSAAAEETPIITIHTNIYENSGAQNNFVIYLGATSETYIDIDGGFGQVEAPVKPAYYDPETRAVTATQVATTVSPDGVVKIYGDPSLIDYIDMTGTYITSIDMPTLTNLDVIILEHNELEALDLTPFTKLSSIIVSDNPMNKSPLVIGANKPDLTILTINNVLDFDPAFNLSDYPELMSFSAWNVKTLSKVDPTGCPKLRQLSIDGTMVETVDISKNPELMILNVTDSRINRLDLSGATKLTELYAQHNSGTVNTDVKFSELDVTACENLVYLYADGNYIEQLDLSKNTMLMMLGVGNNRLVSLNLDNNPYLYEVNVARNNMNFATLPLNPGTWDYYCEQNNLKVDYSYPVGAKIDLASKVLREGYQTSATLMITNRMIPGSASVLDESFYSYSNGVITLNKEVTDSIYAVFYCDAFPETPLATTRFMVKSAAEYGKPSKVITYNDYFSIGEEVKLSVAVEGATPETPKTVYYDFGNGVPVAYTVTTDVLPAEPNIIGKIADSSDRGILVDDGVFVSGVQVNYPLTKFNSTLCGSLKYLNLDNAGLYTINLYDNWNLRSLSMANNYLDEIDLGGRTHNTDKNMLHEINLSGNNLTAFEVPDNRVLHKLNLAGNNISDLMLRDADNLTHLNVADNNLSSLELTYPLGLKSVDASGNKLTQVSFIEGVAPEFVDLSDNLFTFETLPLASSIGNPENYVYAPQAKIELPTKGPGANLSSQYLTLEGNTTQYAWYNMAGAKITEGTDYTITNGRTRFLNTEMGEVYCKMTNGAFPALTLESTPILAAGNPTVQIASFTTPIGGQTAELSFAAKTAGTAVYIDWAEDEDFDQYLLGTTYSRFRATTKAGANVKVYTYEPTEEMTVFSISDIVMGEFDGSKLTSATTITLSGTGMEQDKIILPDGKGIKELNLEGNKLTSFDASEYPNLQSVVLSNNNLSSVDLSPMKNLVVAMVSGNGLENLKVANPLLWGLDAMNNNLDELDCSKVPSMRQLYLSNNNLSSLETWMMSVLKILNVSHNNFNFATLPTPQESWTSYSYGYQPEVRATVSDDCIVDLSFNAKAQSGTPTEYRWFLGLPGIDEEGNIDGEELYENDEYLIENGVTKFLADFNEVYCVMTNADFPDTYMMTNALVIKGAGVESVATESDLRIAAGADSLTVYAADGVDVKLYTIDGICIANAKITDGSVTFNGLTSGIYLVSTPGKTAKIKI